MARTRAEQKKAQLWHDMKAMLVQQERCNDTREAGGLLAGSAKKYGEDVFLAAVQSTVATQPVEAYSYLISLCETAAGKRQSLGKQALSDDERAEVNARNNEEVMRVLQQSQRDVIDA